MGGRSGLGLVFIVELMTLCALLYFAGMVSTYGQVVYFGLLQGGSIMSCGDLVFWLAMCTLLWCLIYAFSCWENTLVILRDLRVVILWLLLFFLFSSVTIFFIL